MSDAPNIWQGNEGRLSEEELTAYLEGRLSPEARREVERWLSEEGLESDAIEGLQHLPSDETRKSVATLNHYLHKQLSGSQKKKRRPVQVSQWLVIAVILVLLLVLLGYAVLHIAAQK